MCEVKKLSLAALICSAVALSATQATADWRFARWGMSVAEVKGAASEQYITRDITSEFADRSGLTPMIEFSPVKLMSINFSGTMYFRKADDKLLKMTLCVQDPHSLGDYERRMIFDSLEKSMGRPLSQKHLPSLTEAVWRDADRNNLITAVLALPDWAAQLPSCLVYEPIKPPSDF